MNRKKQLILGLLALLGFAFLGAAELTGNQATIFMKPQVSVIYGVGATNLLGAISTWSVAGVLLLVSLVAPRLTGTQAVLGFAVMAVGYVILTVFQPQAVFAVVLLAIVGAASIVIAYVRHASENVNTGLPIAPNQIVGGVLVILSQAAPLAVAWSGQHHGVRVTWLWVAGMLGVGTMIGLFLFRRYGTGTNDELGHGAWTVKSARATVVNALSGGAIGAFLGTLTSDIARRGLSQTEWVGFWALGATIAGIFMMLVWARVTKGLRDGGLSLSAIVTLVGAAFAVIERHQTGGAPLIAGGLVIFLGANAFESSVYGVIKPTSAEAVAINFGRALGFGVGLYFSALLLPHNSNTWLMCGFAAVGLLAMVLLREHFQQAVQHPVTWRSWSVQASMVFGLGVCAALILVGGRDALVLLVGTAVSTLVITVAVLQLRAARRRRQ